MIVRVRTFYIGLLMLAASAVVAEPPKDAEKFINHLEFEEYECETLENFIRCDHDVQILILMKTYKGGAYLQNFAETTDRKMKDIIETINTLNAKATVTKFYIDDEGDTMIEAWYPGKYNKKMFANFLEAWQGDTKGQGELISQLFE